MNDTTANTVVGTVIGTVERVTERGEYRTVLLRRPAVDEFERSHADKCLVPFDLTPFVRKKLPAGALDVGACVEVGFRLTGREYNGKQYLSAVIDWVEPVAGAVAVGTEVSPTAEPAAPAEPDPLPF